jgi:hypothetical protein
MEMGKFVPQFLREFELTWDGDAEWKVESSWFAKQTKVLVRYKNRDKKHEMLGIRGKSRKI